jgi:hypothetical protein
MAQLPIEKIIKGLRPGPKSKRRSGFDDSAVLVKKLFPEALAAIESAHHIHQAYPVPPLPDPVDADALLDKHRPPPAQTITFEVTESQGQKRARKPHPSTLPLQQQLLLSKQIGRSPFHLLEIQDVEVDYWDANRPEAPRKPHDSMKAKPKTKQAQKAVETGTSKKPKAKKAKVGRKRKIEEVMKEWEQEEGEESESDDEEEGQTKGGERRRRLAGETYPIQVAVRLASSALRQLQEDQNTIKNNTTLDCLQIHHLRQSIEMVTVNKAVSAFINDFVARLDQAAFLRLASSDQWKQTLRTLALVLREPDPRPDKDFCRNPSSKQEYLDKLRPALLVNNPLAEVDAFFASHPSHRLLRATATSKGPPLTGLLLSHVYAARAVFERTSPPCPPLCDVQAFQRVWDEVMSGIATDFTTSLKEAFEVRLKAYVYRCLTLTIDLVSLAASFPVRRKRQFQEAITTFLMDANISPYTPARSYDADIDEAFRDFYAVADANDVRLVVKTTVLKLLQERDQHVLFAPVDGAPLRAFIEADANLKVVPLQLVRWQAFMSASHSSTFVPVSLDQCLYDSTLNATRIPPTHPSFPSMPQPSKPSSGTVVHSCRIQRHGSTGISSNQLTSTPNRRKA